MFKKLYSQNMTEELYDDEGGFYSRETMFDVATATYWAAVDCHSGKRSAGYEALSKMSRIYKPAPNEYSPGSDYKGSGEHSYEITELYEYLCDSGEDVILMFADYIVDPPTLHDMVNSDEFQGYESDLSGNDLAFNDPERYDRMSTSSEYGGDGSTHGERIEDQRYFINNISDYPDFVKDALNKELDAVEEWHIKNGTIDEEVG